MNLSADRVSPNFVQLLAEHGDVRRVARGGFLIHEGDSSESMFILLTGQLSVFSRDDRGREVIYNQLEPGDMFGEMFLDGGLRSASVKATTSAEYIEVHESTLRSFIKQYPEFSGALVLILIERLRRSTSQVRSLALQAVSARTISSINELAVAEGELRYLPMTVSQRQIAHRIGATREMVNHVFRDLAKGGYLVRDKQGGWLISKALPKH